MVVTVVVTVDVAVLEKEDVWVEERLVVVVTVLVPVEVKVVVSVTVAVVDGVLESVLT